ncbi:zinc carboxypeptidase [Dokdonia sinensis]|uniref:Zinc carboxypeptidase n=1 Tax=Dokdonia sinensis TaxID=2479847 RepID=A0A3M0GG56_9FLAO|nr:M14 family metallopeptidase [Dokdonia sinensis]RMB64071.1 zinc carboxypeptidase [Dokdonia sinensis]
MKYKLLLVICLVSAFAKAQDYFFSKYAPFDQEIPTPEAFLGYPIGEQHTRHDLIVAYLEKLAQVSPRATIASYGKTHENRKLVMLTISTEGNLSNLPSIKKQHLAFVDTAEKETNYDEVPIFIQLGYNVHGNEPSSSEAALLTAYTLVASQHPEIKKYRENSIIFLDPTINPDGRDRHTQWANSFKGSPLVSDNIDAEHTEMWPRGRTNHYWFDLNRDWLLAINPESRGKLDWYHEWYPNVVTDFHEMGTNSTHFFEPMLPIGSENPIMPKENYEDLNNLFAPYFSSALDEIGSFYFTKEAFDGTYPGYGSSYPDLQGALALLFEQASSRGHLQDTDYGTISFPFTIRNQYTSGMATVKASVENKGALRKYQQDFFNSAVGSAERSRSAKAKFDQATAYEFGDPKDKNRTKAFIDKLLKHRIKSYKKGDGRYVVPVLQPQKRMVQSFFETYKKYRDSVYYDASAWSVSNFYNMKHKALSATSSLGQEVLSTDDIATVTPVSKTNYAYLVDYNDYNAPALLHHLQSNGIKVATAFKPFTAKTTAGNIDFNYGTLMIPVSRQDENSQEVFDILREAQEKFQVPVYATNTGFSLKGVDLGSRNLQAIETPKPLMIIGDGTSSYEAGEVWHLLDTRVGMPLTKVLMSNFNRVALGDYNTLIMVSGNYSSLSKGDKERLRNWLEEGNTLITIANATSWAVNAEIVKEKLIKKEKDSTELKSREPYVDAGPNRGKQRVGGAIFEVDLDLTHPLGFGYTTDKLPVYKNNNVWLQPSNNEYNTVAQYTENPHIDGFISDENLNDYMKKSASLVVSRVGRGRVILFADNPNFRGSWYGTNKLFLNAIFFGSLID